MAEYEGISDDSEPLAVGGMVIAAGTPDRQIEKHFETGRLRVVQEKNDLFLSHVMQFISGEGSAVWGNLRPEYQRRLRWDNKKKSKLVESFIMNVPVPPVFLYEKELGRFEVMDGQQRLNAIAEYFNGEFELEGLEIWQALNGRTYKALPPLIRRGLERAKISAITLMSDNTSSGENSIELRAQVFERLNTGGEQLNQQELRNSLFSGDFNTLLIELSQERAFTDAWEIPNHEENVRADRTVSKELADNTLFKRMTDVEIVLRFFALRDVSSLSGSVRSMLDNTMKRNRKPNEVQRSQFAADFRKALNLCLSVFEEDAFRLPRTTPDKPGKLSRPLYDAEMIALYNLREHHALLIENRAAIRAAVLRLAEPGTDDYELLVGRGNTANTIRLRISKLEEVVRETINV